MKKTLIASTLFFAVTTMLSGCVVHVGHANAQEGEDISSVFGSVDVATHRSVGDLSSVNGDVSLEDHAQAEDISVVNGSVEMGSHVRVDEINIVNGDLDAGSHLHVANSIETVNGDINIEQQSTIQGSVETVNGDIQIAGSIVDSNIESMNGDITLKGDTLVKGDIIYKIRDEGWLERNSTKPKLTIEADVSIGGSIILERPVNLDIASPALQEKVIVSYSSSK